MHISGDKTIELECSAARVLPRAMVRGRRNPLHFGLASRLKKARMAACLSFDSVADAAGLPDGNTVFQLERKAGHAPRLDTVERIAYGLGLSPAFLAFGVEGKCPRRGTLRSGEAGVRLRAARQAQDLTMRALARAAGLTDTAVRSTETGASIPTIATVEALAVALNVSAAWLAYGIGNRELPPRRRSGAVSVPAAAERANR